MVNRKFFEPQTTSIYYKIVLWYNRAMNTAKIHFYVGLVSILLLFGIAQWILSHIYQHNIYTFITQEALFPVYKIGSSFSHLNLFQYFNPVCNENNYLANSCNFDSILLFGGVGIIIIWIVALAVVFRKTLSAGNKFFLFFLVFLLVGAHISVFFFSAYQAAARIDTEAQQYIKARVDSLSDKTALTDLGFHTDLATINSIVSQAPKTTFHYGTNAVQKLLIEKQTQTLDEDINGSYFTHYIVLNKMAQESTYPHKEIAIPLAYSPKSRTAYIFDRDQSLSGDSPFFYSQNIIRERYSQYIDDRSVVFIQLPEEKYKEYIGKNDDNLDEKYKNSIEEQEKNIERVKKRLEEAKEASTSGSPTASTKYTERRIANLESQLEETKEFYEDFKNHSIQVDSQAGVFLHPNEIVIKIYDEALNDAFNRAWYRHVSLHELLHLYSYPADYNYQEKFSEYLEEGITNYLAFPVMYEQLNYYWLGGYGYSGYYHETQVIILLLEKIPEEELLTVYFNQDIRGFKRLFAKYYPGVDYKEYEALADAMFFAETDYESNQSLERIRGLLAQQGVE